MGKRTEGEPQVQADPGKVGQPGPTNPNCLACGRWRTAKTPFMPPTVPPKARAAFVGEGPGGNEDRLGKQFVGPAGHVLNGCMERSAWKREEVEFHNAVRCSASKPTAREIKLCRPFLIQDLRQSRPRVVLALGATAGASLQADNRCTVKRDRGRDLAIPDLGYTPKRATLTYHPASILHGNEENRDYITDDLALLRRTAPTEGTEAAEITDLKDLARVCKGYSRGPAFSIDLEWSEEKDTILSVAISRKRGTAHWFPVSHNESKWTWAQVEPHLRTLCESDAIKVGHNIPGDAVQLARKGINLRGQFADTLTLVKMFDENYPDKTLEHLAIRFLNMPDYAQALRPYRKGIKLVDHEEMVTLKSGKTKLKQHYRKSKDYGNIPLAILGPYNGADADAGWRAFEKWWPRAKKAKWFKLFLMYMRAARMLARNTLEGFYCDVKELDRAEKEITAQAVKLKRDFLKLLKKTKLWDKTKFFKWEGRGYDPKDECLRLLLFSRARLGLKPIVFTDEEELPSTSKKALAKLWGHKRNKDNKLGRQVVDMVIGTEDEDGNKTLGLRQYEKLIGTYLIRLKQRLIWFEKRTFPDGTVWPAGYYFCPGYIIAGARTGRLSSRPNIQNIPPVIRRAFKSRFGRKR